jgi:prepilin-type N-terminal cleavage/methylation domain-containing protein
MRPRPFLKNVCRAFTLIETVLAVALLGLLAGALYAVTHAALEAARTSMDDQIWYERTDAFLRATRKAFLTMPGRARLGLRYETGGGAATPEIVFADAGSYFGMTTTGGGQIVLTAPAQADGTRTFGVLRIPPGDTDRRRNPGQWFPLLPKVEKVEWAFLVEGEWRSEWDLDAPRPPLVRLRFVSTDGPASEHELFFWLPSLVRVQPGQTSPDENQPPPEASPTP